MAQVIDPADGLKPYFDAELVYDRATKALRYHREHHANIKHLMRLCGTNSNDYPNSPMELVHLYSDSFYYVWR